MLSTTSTTAGFMITPNHKRKFTVATYFHIKEDVINKQEITLPFKNSGQYVHCPFLQFPTS